MPRLRELNIQVGVPLFGILREGQLPSVTTLSVPIRQYGPVYEVTSIIRACPNVVLLRLNVNGEPEPIWTGGGSRLSNSKCRRALEAAAALESLQALEMFKSGDFYPHGCEDGWVPVDLKGLYKASKTCGLTNDGTNSKFSHQAILPPYLQSGSLRTRGI